MKRLPDEHFKASHYPLDTIDVRLQEWEREGFKSRLIQSYLCHDMVISLHLFGYVMRNGSKGPSKHLRLSFQRSYEGLMPSVVPKIRYRNHHYTHAYDMKVSVLVDVVEKRQLKNRPAEFYELVVPSVVRLQELDSPALFEAEALNSWPLRSGLDGLLELHRKGRVFSDLVRDTSPETANVKLEDDVVESRAQIEESVPENEGAPSTVERWPRVSVEAVLMSHVLSLHGDAIRVDGVVPRVVGSDSGDFSLERFVVLTSALPLLPRIDKLPSHEERGS